MEVRSIMEREFPLQWPASQPRTERRDPGKFQRSLNDSRVHLIKQVQLAGGSDILISSNYGGLSGKSPADPGVAVYFNRRNKRLAMGCDRWRLVAHNLTALGNSIEAMRGIDRWGCSHLMEQAFSAFEALPAPGWRQVLQLIGGRPSLEDAEASYRALVKKHHPDAGGNQEQFLRIQKAVEDARRELN
jgi:hypothetical protein